MPKFIFLLLLITLAIGIFPASLLAQVSDVTSGYQVKDLQAADGDILVLDTTKGLVRSAVPYDSHLFGVVYNKPLIVFRTAEGGDKPVIRAGTADVSVTTLNGPIKVGDYITSSPITGTGQKALLSGYVLGTALSTLDENDGPTQSYTPPEGKEAKTITSGKVKVAIKIEYAEIDQARSASRLLSSVNSALFSNISDPSKSVQIFRYVTAGAVVLLGFVIGFFTFSRSIPKSIEAIGRNPLAEKAIIFSIILSVVLTVLTASVGIIAAAFILKL